MKLYIWNEPYRVRYGSSIVYAVAETEEQARELAEKAPKSPYGLGVENGGCKLKGRAPDRVLELPCAEIYEWSE